MIFLDEHKYSREERESAFYESIKVERDKLKIESVVVGFLFVTTQTLLIITLILAIHFGGVFA